MAGDPQHHSGLLDGDFDRPSTFMERLSQTFLKPPKPRPEKPEGESAEDKPVPLSEEEQRRLVTDLDPTELKIGYTGAALAAVIALIAFVPFIVNPKMTQLHTQNPGKNHSCPSLYSYQKYTGHYTCVGHLANARHTWVILLVITLLFALAMFVTTRIGRRAPLAFATLMTGLAFFSIVQSILALAFLGGGGWLLIRAWRAQRYGAPTAKAGAASTNGSRARSRSSATTRSSRSTRSKAQAPEVGGSGRTKPTPNKRYTPKTPQRKRVPPAT